MARFKVQATGLTHSLRLVPYACLHPPPGPSRLCRPPLCAFKLLSRSLRGVWSASTESPFRTSPNLWKCSMASTVPAPLHSKFLLGSLCVGLGSGKVCGLGVVCWQCPREEAKVIGSLSLSLPPSLPTRRGGSNGPTAAPCEFAHAQFMGGRVFPPRGFLLEGLAVRRILRPRLTNKLNGISLSLSSSTQSRRRRNPLPRACAPCWFGQSVR